MSEQLSFRLPIKVARERDAFFVSEANQQAVAQLENTAIWPQGKLILLGPKACGKTHLLEIWATCLLYTSPSPRDRQKSRMPSSA